MVSDFLVRFRLDWVCFPPEGKKHFRIRGYRVVTARKDSVVETLLDELACDWLPSDVDYETSFWGEVGYCKFSTNCQAIIGERVIVTSTTTLIEDDLDPDIAVATGPRE